MKIFKSVVSFPCRSLRLIAGEILVLFLFTGCANKVSIAPYEHITAEIKKSLGAVMPTENDEKKTQLPPGVSLADGLSEREAVAIVLWNNVQFHADLSQLGISRAEVLQAGQIQNPNFYVLFPIGLKQLEARLFWNISEIQMRPHRLAVAMTKARQTADSLIQNGLTLARNTQIAFANLYQNRKQVSLAKRKVTLMTEISEIEIARVELGDSSELESHRNKVEALLAMDQLTRLIHDGTIFHDRLSSLLGIVLEMEINLDTSPATHNVENNIEAFLEIAFAASPELRIAKLQIKLAGEQIGLENSKIFNFMALLDGRQVDGLVRPGISMDLPIFNQNQGGIARAQAQLHAAGKQYVAIREKIRLAVQEAYTQYHAALEGFDLIAQQVLPQQEERVKLSNQALEKGDISYLTNLDMERQLIETQLRQAEVMGDLMRKTADLGLSIGRPIDLWSTAL